MDKSRKYPNWNIAYLQQVQLRIGSAVWQFQGFEDTLAKFVTLVFKLTTEQARTQATEILEKTKRQTMGQLVKELRRQATIPEDFEKRLDRLIDDRNWVIHHSFQAFLGNIHDSTACLQLVRRIEQIDLEAHVLNQVLWESVAKMSDEHDAAITEIDSLAQQIRQKWKTGDPGKTVR